MPGEVKQLTTDELAKLEAFPLPTQGTVVLKTQGIDRYVLECSNITGADLKRVEEFVERMQGGLYAFRYESRTHRFPQCRFVQDEFQFSCDGPNRCRTRLAFEVFPPHAT